MFKFSSLSFVVKDTAMGLMTSSSREIWTTRDLLHFTQSESSFHI